MASMYRAITAHPDPRSIPNVEFILDLHDNSQPGPEGKIRFTWARHKDNPYMWVIPVSTFSNFRAFSSER